MIFAPTELPGVVVLEADKRHDERGFFARTFCARELAERGLDPRAVQMSVSFNARRGTLRGMHFSRAPWREPKLVRCTRGAVFDVVVDLRVGSPAFLRWAGVELSEENHRGLFVPPGCAHGFLTLRDATEVLYVMGEYFAPDVADGLPYDDAALGIAWPEPVTVLSERDRAYAPWSAREASLRPALHAFAPGSAR